MRPPARPRPHAAHRSVVAGGLLLAAGTALAQSADSPAAPAPAAGETVIRMLETTRDEARRGTEWLARRIDSWFGDRPFEDGGKVSDGRLTLDLFRRTDQSARLDLRFSAKVRLPNVERQAYLFIGRDDPRSAVQDTPDAFSRRQRLPGGGTGERSVLAGLGVTLPQGVDLRLGLGAGLRPYLQARYGRPLTLAPGHVLDFRETLFWTSSDRIGATTSLAYGLQLAPALDLRWLGAATLTQATRNLEWQSSLGLYRAWPGQRLLSLEALTNGSGRHGTGVGRSDHGMLVKWEQPWHQDWLLGEVTLGRFRPRPDADSPRGQAWALGAALKIHF